MISKIGYENKTALQNDEDVPETQKVTDQNMNEIKKVVNDNADETQKNKEDIDDLKTDNENNQTDLNELKNKVTTLEGDNSQNKENIETLQDKQDDLILEINSILNGFPTETKEGSNIEFENILETYFKEFIVKGNSIQNGVPSPINEISIENVSGNINISLVNTEDETKEQTVLFPLLENQKMMIGDYLSVDGIHHIRNQKVINGTEEWIYYSSDNEWCRPYTMFNDKKIGENDTTNNVLCNKAKPGNWSDVVGSNNYDYKVFTYSGDRRVSIALKKSDLLTQNASGVKKYFSDNKMVIEYNLQEETVETYTDEQQNAYKNLLNLKAYRNAKINSPDNIVPIFKVTAIKSMSN